MPESITYLGKVKNIQGTTVVVDLDDNTVSGFKLINGEGYHIGQIGTFVYIPIGLNNLFGIISQAGAQEVPEAQIEDNPYGNRWITVQLVGEGNKSRGFNRGISQYPTIDSKVHIVTEEELKIIYGSSNDGRFVRIGSVASSKSIPAFIDINKLVTRHSAVVGSTGAGKSTTVSTILNSISDSSNYPSARIILLDIHGEYNTALKDRATIFKIEADETKGEKSLYIPYWALSLEELLRIIPLEDKNNYLTKKITELKIASLIEQPRDGVKSDTLTADTPIPFSIHRLWYELNREEYSIHKTKKGSHKISYDLGETTEVFEKDTNDIPLRGDIMDVKPAKYEERVDGNTYISDYKKNIGDKLSAMESMLRDVRYDFLFRPGDWCPRPDFNTLDAQPDQDFDSLLKSWIGSDKPITILDLSGIPSAVLSNLIGALIRILFDSLFWAQHLPEGGRERPLLFVLEEAHTYLHTGPASLAVQRIVKEGRKYGLGIMLISQRPFEINPTILSQCGTIFAMRLSNQTDRSQITGTSSDSLGGLFESLPVLRTGEVIIVGESVHLPLRALIDEPAEDRRPESNDPKVYDPDKKSGWSNKKDEDYTKVMKTWRSQNPNINEEEKDG